VASETWSNEGLNFMFVNSVVAPSGTTIYYCQDLNNTCTPNKLARPGETIIGYNNLVGIYYIRYKAINGVGLESKVASYKAQVDIEQPSCVLTTAGTLNTSETVYLTPVDVSFESYSDTGGSGVKKYGIGSVNGEKTITHTTDSNDQVEYIGHIIDNAGNTATCPITFKKNSNLTIAYNSNTGSVCIPTTKTVRYNEKYGELCTPTKTGYTFAGWYTEASGGTKIDENTTVTIRNNHTVYAHWTANTYVVTLDGNGATNSPTESINATYDATTLSTIETLPTKPSYDVSFNANNQGANISSTAKLTAAYTFEGWNTTTGDMETITSDGIRVASNAKTPVLEANVPEYTNESGQWKRTEGATFYAQWSGGSITLPTVSKTGYTCKWYENSSGTGTSYTGGSRYTPTANITLYAKCISDCTQTAAEAICGGYNDCMENGTYYINTRYTYTAFMMNLIPGLDGQPVLEKGKCFTKDNKCWIFRYFRIYKDASGSERWNDSRDCPAPGGTTAGCYLGPSVKSANDKWVKAYYYATNPRSEVFHQPEYVYATAKPKCVLYFDLNGCLNGSCEGTLGSYGTCDVYINGSRVKDDVTDYYQQHPTGTTYEIKDCKAKTGYAYVGAHSGSTLTGTVGGSSASVYVDFVTKNTITLNGNGATTAGSTSATVTYNATSLSTITNPQKKYTVAFDINGTGATATTTTLTANYTLNGWYTATSDGTKVASNSTTPALQASVSGYTDANNKWTRTSDATLYAQWTSASVTLPTITITGAVCTWNTKADGTGTNYNGGDSFTPTVNTTLYAKCVIAVAEYAYTGYVQTFTAPMAGNYKLEVWGSQGGKGHGGEGGKGAYVSATVSLNKNQEIYVIVGGRNGYNGGGSAKTDNDYGSAGKGGGATHIASTNRGTLPSYKDYQSEVYIVAGGGGGGGGSGYRLVSPVQGGGKGGNAGKVGSAGDTGKTASDSIINSLSGTGGTGASQSGGGTGGSTGSHHSNGYDGSYYRGCGGGGGGGWYGGGGGASGWFDYRSGLGEGYNGSGGSFGQGGNGGQGASHYSEGWHTGAGGGGGGGSSWVNSALSNSSYTAGDRSGDGYAKITWLG
ncbi:MAG: InlB B-repeat-containing protein, partial [Clostridia bacterium]|nr:InlB B-repeat-containing protein [Clostridia bacterium]